MAAWKRSPRSRLVVNLLLAVASAAGSVALLEMGARLLDLQTGFFLQVTGRNCVRRSSLLGYEFQANCEGDLRGTIFRTNSLGLRGDQVRDDGSRRILAIGDSCTWGWHVAQDESYPAILQRLLDQELVAGRYQVLNAGAPGSTSYQGLLYLRERGLALQPEIVIAGFGFNDQFEKGDVEKRLARERAFMPLLRFDDYLLETSRLYRWVRWQGDRSSPEVLPPRVPPEKYQRNLARIAELSREHGAKAVILSFWNPLGPSKDYRTAVREVAVRLRVPVVTYEGPRIDVVHPTAAGYEGLARRIFERLQQEEYVG